MPEKVTLASQRNLNDIPHRSEAQESSKTNTSRVYLKKDVCGCVNLNIY